MIREVLNGKGKVGLMVVVVVVTVVVGTVVIAGVVIFTGNVAFGGLAVVVVVVIAVVTAGIRQLAWNCAGTTRQIDKDNCDLVQKHWRQRFCTKDGEGDQKLD